MPTRLLPVAGFGQLTCSLRVCLISGDHAITFPLICRPDFYVLVRHLPEWAPGAGFLKKARIWREQMEEFVDEPYEFVKESMVRRRPYPRRSVQKANLTCSVKGRRCHRFALLFLGKTRLRTRRANLTCGGLPTLCMLVRGPARWTPRTAEYCPNPL